MDLLVGTSLVAAFAAGIAALFAPCCITVLLPSYLGSIFRERYKVFLMTFIFFLGILTVFLPLGLGFAALGQLFARYHSLVFGIGGALLLFLGIGMLAGQSFSLPFTVHPTLKKHNAFSVFVLGIFSGIATTCCAPVLAGVMALSAMSGSLLWGMLYTIAYVLGMVTPLFLIAVFLDRYDVAHRMHAMNTTVSYRAMGRSVVLTISQLVAGTIFAVMGISTVYFAFTRQLVAHSGVQTDINIMVTRLLQSINGLIGAIPQVIWGGILVLSIALIVRRVVRIVQKEK